MSSREAWALESLVVDGVALEILELLSTRTDVVDISSFSDPAPVLLTQRYRAELSILLPANVGRLNLIHAEARLRYADRRTIPVVITGCVIESSIDSLVRAIVSVVLTGEVAYDTVESPPTLLSGYLNAAASQSDLERAQQRFGASMQSAAEVFGRFGQAANRSGLRQEKQKLAKSVTTGDVEIVVRAHRAVKIGEKV